MTTPRTPSTPQQPRYADRAFRSPFGVAAGVLLLAIGAWMAGDALVVGPGRVRWLVMGAVLLGAPLVIAFTLRPVVYAGTARMLVRNPFRTVSIPWGAVEAVRSGYSNEVLAGGRKYQLWSIPVSMRARSKAVRRDTDASTPVPAPADQHVHELREMAERRAADEAAQGEVAVRWAYEITVPAVVGAVLLAVLWATG